MPSALWKCACNEEIDASDADEDDSGADGDADDDGDDDGDGDDGAGGRSIFWRKGMARTKSRKHAGRVEAEQRCDRFCFFLLDHFLTWRV